MGCEPWLRARRAGMKTRILSAHISFSINMTGIIRRAYVVWDNQTSIQSAAVLDHVLDSECRTARKAVKTCPMQSKRPELFGVSYAPTATHRAATTGDPTCTRSPATLHTHGLTDTHRDHARTVMRGYGARRDIIDVHMRETRKTCGHLLHPQIRTARESSLTEASIFETRGRGATCSRPSSTVHARQAETTLGAP